MNPRFKALLETLEANYRKLLMMRPATASDIQSNTPVGGVYLFSEDEKHLYAGRTRRPIHERVRNQFGANPSAASFPWLIARRTTGRAATYRKGKSRKTLLDEADFRKAYDDAIKRIRNMHVRYVHEPDPVRQTLLEIYVAIVTKAEYNDFDTH